MEKKKILTTAIDDGTQEIQLTNMYGDAICKVRFRPTDFSILDRYAAFTNDFESIVEPLKQIGISNNGEADTDESWKILKGVETEIIKRFNGLFDMSDAEKIFEKRNAFSSVNGKFFCENVLLALGDVVANAIEEETKSRQKKMEKYLP